MENEQLFDAYFNNHLDSDAKNSFEGQLKADDNYRAAYEKYAEEKVNIESHFLKKELDFAPPTSPKGGGNPRWILLLIAALLMSFATYYFLNKSEPAPVEPSLYVYSQYSPHPGTPVSMSVTETSEFEDGMIDYKEGNSIEAILKWKALYEQEPDNHDLNFFLANAHIKKKEIEKSIKYLKLSAETNGIYEERAEWILALIELDKQNLESMRQIAGNPYHSFHSKADVLLGTIEK